MKSLLLYRVKIVAILLFPISIYLSSCESLGEIDDIVDSNPPNIILIITDDQRFDALGFMQQDGKGRFPWLKTPHLDKLADEGVVFTNAFVTTSLCSPSRAAILTGQYNHINAIQKNDDSFNSPSFASMLASRGYETAYFGKWHMGQQLFRPGFKYSYSFIGQGEYFDAVFYRNSRYRTKTKGWVDEVSTSALLESLPSSSTETPFCFVIGYKTAHSPWDKVPEGVRGLYTGEKSGLIESMGRPPGYKPLGSIGKPENYFKNYWKLYRDRELNYFRGITALDTQIGRIMDGLEEKGLEDNTVVIFMSDNGYHFGEHNLRIKRVAYEESMRIPLIIKDGTRGRAQIKKVIDELVLNIDIAPTILGFAGVRTDEVNNLNMQGRSLKPLMNSEPVSWRESFIYRYEQEPSFEPPVHITALRTKNYKLITYDENEEWIELYNLHDDPYEINNVKNDNELLEYHIELLEQEKMRISLP